MKTIIVEDSRLARSELRELLKEHPQLQLVAESGKPEEAIELINNHQPDLLFMDINMPGKNGFDVLESIAGNPRVIFTTAYADYAIKSFDYNTVDYLLKPISPERLARALEKIASDPTRDDGAGSTDYTDTPVQQESKLDMESRIFIKDGDNCHLVALTNIDRFESCGNYTQVFFDGGKAFVYRALGKIEERLPEKAFFRASRQHIVNLRCVKDIEPWVNGGYRLTLENGEEIAVSRRHASRLKELLSL